MYNITSDCHQELYYEDKIKLVSYGVYGFYGQTGVGKTYQMNEIAKAYKDEASLSTYDLMESNINNGDITYDFYISPTIKNDLTMKTQGEQSTTYIVANDENINTISTLITTMAADMSTILELEDVLLTNSTLSTEKKQLIVEKIEETKQKYPELRFKTDLGETIYDQVNIKYDGFLLRREKIIIRFDDYQGTKITNSTRNDFYKLLINRRHLGIWFCGLVFHTFSNATDATRTLQNFTILYEGLDYEVIKKLFGEFPKLETDNFDEEAFLSIYKQLKNFDFMIVEESPETYLGISWGENKSM